MKIKSLFTVLFTAATIALCSFCVAAQTVEPSGDKSGETDRYNIQQSIDDGGETVLSAGEYFINDRLNIRENGITIKAEGAVVTQVTPHTAIVAFRADKPAYNGVNGFTLDGGTWVENTEDKAGYGNGVTAFRIIHAADVTIKNATFLNCNEGHQIELAGVRDSVISGCSFGGTYTGDEISNEAIQLDVCHSSGMVGNMDYYDDTYCKNIVIENCKIDYHRGVGTHNVVSNHYADGIIIRGNTITSDREAINIFGAVNVTIENNTITGKRGTGDTASKAIGIDIKATKSGSTDKIYAANENSIEPNSIPAKGLNIKIVNNTVKGFSSTQGCSNGIRILGKLAGSTEYGWKSEITGVTVQGNTISGTEETAIDVTGANSITLKSNTVNNTIKSGIGGISVLSCKGVILYGNTVKSVKGRGITISSSDDCTAEKNNISSTGKYGISLLKLKNAKIIGNTVSSSADHGMAINECTGSTIKSNTVTKPAASGLSVQKCPNIVISSNKISKASGYGMGITGCAGFTASKNTVNSSKNRSIWVNSCKSATIKSNTVTGCGDVAIAVKASTGVSVYGNTVTSPKKNGIYLYDGSSKSVVEKNTMSDCKATPIQISSSKNMTVKSNKITGSTDYIIKIDSKSSANIKSMTLLKPATAKKGAVTLTGVCSKNVYVSATVSKKTYKTKKLSDKYTLKVSKLKSGATITYVQKDTGSNTLTLSKKVK